MSRGSPEMLSSFKRLANTGGKLTRTVPWEKIQKSSAFPLGFKCRVEDGNKERNVFLLGPFYFWDLEMFGIAYKISLRLSSAFRILLSFM